MIPNGPSLSQSKIRPVGRYFLPPPFPLHLLKPGTLWYPWFGAMPIQKVLEGRVPVKIWAETVEASALEQLRHIAALPFVFKHVAVMPDVHLGKGATVGSVVISAAKACSRSMPHGAAMCD